MAARPLPLSAVKIIAMESETTLPGSVDLVAEDGTLVFGGSGIAKEQGTVTIQARRDVGWTKAQKLQAESQFEAWHRSLRGNDNQATLQRYGGLYSGGPGSVIVTAALRWVRITDDAGGGSLVQFNVSPSSETLADSLVVGAPITILGQLTTITSVVQRSGPGIADPRIIVADRLPAQSQVTETVLPFDWTTLAGSTGMGAVEAGAGRLIMPVVAPNVTARLAPVSIDTGRPELTNPVGSLLDAAGDTAFASESAVGAVASLADGRYVVAHADKPQFVIVNVDGQLATGQKAADATETIAVLATTSTAPLPAGIAGATQLGAYVYFIDDRGRIHRVQTANLTNNQTGTFTGVNAGLDWVQAEPVGSRRAQTMAGMWVSGGQLTVLRSPNPQSWRIERLAISGGTVTPTEQFRPTRRPFRGATEVGGVLYAAANNRIYRYAQAGDTSIQLGRATSFIDVNILAKGVPWPKTSRHAIPTVTYRWRQV